MEAEDDKILDDFICWISEDWDDWNSFIDYEDHLADHVIEFNKIAKSVGVPLIGLWKEDEDALSDIFIISKVKNEFENEELRKLLSHIIDIANWRIISIRPTTVEEIDEMKKDGDERTQIPEEYKNISEWFKEYQKLELLDNNIIEEKDKFIKNYKERYHWDVKLKLWIRNE